MKIRSKYASDRVCAFTHAGRWTTKTVGEASEAEYKLRLQEVPADTRDTTAVICGDPLIGRRAIDRRAP